MKPLSDGNLYFIKLTPFGRLYCYKTHSHAFSKIYDSFEES